MDLLTASGTTDCRKLASAICHRIRQRQHLAIQVIGASALNCAVKACTIARGRLAPEGIVLAFTPSLREVTPSHATEEVETASAIQLTVIPLSEETVLQGDFPCSLLRTNETSSTQKSKPMPLSTEPSLPA